MGYKFEDVVDLGQSEAPKSYSFDEAMSDEKRSYSFDEAMGTAPASELQTGFGPVPSVGALADQAARTVMRADQNLSAGLLTGVKDTLASAPQGWGALAGSSTAIKGREQLAQFDAIDAGGSPTTGMGQLYSAADGPRKLELRQRSQMLQKQSAETHPAYQLGDEVSKMFPEWKPDEGVVGDIGKVFGSIAGNIGVGLATGTAGVVPFTMLGGMGETGKAAVDYSQKQVAQGKAPLSPDQMQTATALGAPIGLTEFVDTLIPTLGGVKQAAGFLSKVGVKVAFAAFLEGGQEWVQQLAQNAVAKGIYNPEQDIWEGATYSFLLGAIGGAGMRGLHARQEAMERGVTNAAPGDQSVVDKLVSDVADGMVAPVAPTEFGGRARTGGVQTQVEPAVEETTIRAVPQGVEISGGGQTTVLQSATDDVDRLQVRLSVFKDGPLFYSGLARAAEERLPESGTPEQMMATLRQTPGVKQEEWEYTKLDQLFAQVEGKVTKNDILTHLRENAVQIKEVVRPGDIYGRVDEVGAPNPTQYEEYTLPGPRSDYVELLLTLPSRPGKPGPRGWGDTGGGTLQSDANFVGSHFTDPNIVAHARISERQDHTGALTLVVEEMQSDWHQRGRKEGYGINQLERYRELTRRMQDPELRQQMSDEEIRQWGELTGPGKLNAVPDAPFKSTQAWAELALKRTLRWAADNGHEKIAFTTAQQQIDRYPGLSTEQKQGMREFYDRILPSIVKKYAKRYGAATGTTLIPSWDLRLLEEPKVVRTTNGREWYEVRAMASGGEQKRHFQTELAAKEFADMIRNNTGFHEVPYIEVTKKMRSGVREGLPLFSKIAGPIKTTVANDDVRRHKHYRGTLDLMPLMDKLKAAFEIKVPVRFVLEDMPSAALAQSAGTYGGLTVPYGNQYMIRIAMGMHPNVEAIYATMVHEFAHVVFNEHFERLSNEEKQALRAGYERKIDAMRRDPNVRSMKLGEWLAKRDNAVTHHYGLRPDQDKPLYALTREEWDYWLGYEEYFVENMTRWATTPGEQPHTYLEKVFVKLAATIRRVFELAQRIHRERFAADAELTKWFRQFVDRAPPFGAENYDALDTRTQRINASRIEGDKTGPAVPQQPETEVLERIADNLPAKEAKDVRKTRAYADHIRWYDRVFNHVYQLVERNPLNEPLRRFAELRRAYDAYVSSNWTAVEHVLKLWEGVRPQQSEALIGFIDDVGNMRYRSAEEKKNGTRRQPTAEEVAELQKRHKMEPGTVELYGKIDSFIRTHLRQIHGEAIAGARWQIADPVRLAAKIDKINAEMETLWEAPYFPFMRFGRHFVVVRDSAGNVVHRVHNEERGPFPMMERWLRDTEVKLKRQFPESKGFKVYGDVISEAAQPMIGLPQMLKDRVAGTLNITDDQRNALKELENDTLAQYQYVPGYSMDFQRSFAKYAFHSSRYLGRVKYAPAMYQAVQDERLSQPTAANRTRRAKITDYMNDAYNQFINPSKDFVYLKGGTVLWTLAFVPSSAYVNLMQTPMLTFTFLSAKFGGFAGIGLGNVRAAKAIVKSIAKYENFYKKGYYKDQTRFEMAAINYGIASGRLDQTIAAEVAGHSEHDNLMTGMMVGSRAQKTYHKAMKYGMAPFELAEKANRRIAYMATLDLAMQMPERKFVKETVAKYPMELEKLQAQGFSATEAAAIVTAAHVVEQTQFMQGEGARPLFLRGKLGTVFLYKRYIQGVLFTTLNNKRDVGLQFLIMSMLLAGLKGIPGYDDLEGILRALAWVWRKDFKLTDWLREHIKEVTKSAWQTDSIIHGTSRNSFGVPALFELLGAAPGTIPRFDMSGAISSNTILPFDFGKTFGPSAKSPMERTGEAAVKAGGAIGSVAESFYKALSSNDDPSEFARWQVALPRALRNITQAGRAALEGTEKNTRGAKTVPFNIRDTTEAAELLGMAMGFQPTAKRKYWDSVMAGVEANKVVELRRNLLLKQLDEAVRTGQQSEKDRVISGIREFNLDIKNTVPDKAISSDTMRKSLEGRARSRAAQEQGVSVRKSDIPLMRKYQELYGVDVKNIRKIPGWRD